MKILTALAATTLTAFSMAHAAMMVVDVNSEAGDPNGNSVTVTLDAGSYELSFIDGLYDAWNAWDNVTDCDSNGENCSRGWITNLDVLAEGTIYKIGRHGKFATPEQALAAASSFTLVLTAMTDVTFFINDHHLPDNVGGVSLKIASTAVPVPAAGLAFVTGAAAFAGASRRKRAA